MDAVEGAFADLASGKANMPQRTPIRLEEEKGLVLFMPTHIRSLSALGAKIVTVYPDNPKNFELPSIYGTILILDEKTGFPMGILEGGFLTAMRTGAVSGVATKHMARKDAKAAMIFGTGVQAYAQILAVHEARPLEKLLTFSIDPQEKKDEFSKKVSDAIGVEVDQVSDPADGVKRADIVVLATSAHDPIVDGDWFGPGVHINSIGSHAPGMRELDTKTVQKSRVICDLVDACKAEAGDLIIPCNEGAWNFDQAAGSLGDVVLGNVPGRTSDDETTLFKSVGLAIQDLSVAKAVYDQAVKQGVGTEFEF